MDLPKLIFETKSKQQNMVESMSRDQVLDLKKKDLINQLELMRIDVIKEFQEQQVAYSFQVTKEPQPIIDFDELDEDELINIKQKLRIVDEDLSERARNLIEKQSEIIKNKIDNEALTR